ncbi:hypothetical protein IFM89_029967 [Coptis chinensis]|uniref:Chaperone DnaJ C-terminal domain-containing protein n=1 Tax=Coptis chinensis TaxID=261450 RepID=A0A835IF41_9MAGN|nr:hypothetical protein IFM89_029967 [Coptis chinensis]
MTWVEDIKVVSHNFVVVGVFHLRNWADTLRVDNKVASAHFVLLGQHCYPKSKLCLNGIISKWKLFNLIHCIKQVKTVDGITKLQVPPGIQPGDVVVLAKKGAPKLKKPTIRGDHLFTVKVSIPKRISARERELLEELSLLNEITITRTRTRLRPQTTTKIAESQPSTDVESSEDSGSQSDLWEKLKGFAGILEDDDELEHESTRLKEETQSYAYVAKQK